jgi:palmitoyltransferase
VKATQYGVLERLKELVDSGQCDPNKSDSENVYLLHWAAINNRLDIAQYLLSVGSYVDPVGGELESTPLNWAARSGHIQMVMYLIQNGANQYLFDLEGYSTIHLATMFGHSIVVAYLLAKGMDVSTYYLYLHLLIINLCFKIEITHYSFINIFFIN